MTNLKIQHLLTLTYLLSKGARYNYVMVTTTSLGRSVKKSQQAASKHLVELEKDGFVRRIINGRNISVKITPKGYLEMTKISRALQSSLESHPAHVILKGTLTSGMGEGAYYMSLKGYTRQFKAKIGYVPFPGTLNVRLDRDCSQTVSQFDALDGKIIKGFSDGKRTYGWVRCFGGVLNRTIECNLIRLERTHHDPSTIELISGVNIRRAGRLRDGSKITIKIPMD